MLPKDYEDYIEELRDDHHTAIWSYVKELEDKDNKIAELKEEVDKLEEDIQDMIAQERMNL